MTRLASRILAGSVSRSEVRLGNVEMHAEHLEKRKLNQLAPISRLHPEIFSNIFCHVRDSIIRPAPSMWAWGCTKDWIDLTHVCHAWRDIAINDPMLWAEIFISVEDHLEWVQEMLRRSEQCSLSILISKPPEGTLSTSKAVDPILRELKDNMHRIRELRLLAIPIDSLDNFFSNSHARRLEYLHITIPDCTSDTASDTSSPNTPSAARFTLTNNVLRVDSLRHLSIEGCGLDFHAAFLRSLTHLELLNIDEDCRLPCIEFVAILTAMPRLERLILEEFLKDEVGDVEEFVAITNKTHLHIKYLDLSCYILEEMVQFLCILILPSSCKLRLRISYDGPEITPGFPLITSWLSRHYQSAPSFHSFRSYFRSWHIEDTSYVTSTLQVMGFYDSELEGSHTGGEIDKALLSASVSSWHDYGSEDESIDNFWRSFLKSLPLGNIVSLEVTGDSVTPPDSVWVEVFASLTILKTITINSNNYAAFFHIASPDSSNSKIALPFPALSSVIVKAQCVDDYLSIANSLDSRLEAGLVPFSLVFYTDDIKSYAITQLRKSALNVQIHQF